jgi:competence protein ComEC
VLSLAVAAVLVSFLAVNLPDDRLHVSFLDVGQGDAILIQKGSQQVLVDGGPSPQAVCLGLGEKMPFWDRTIELMVLSHPSADHVTGLVEVLSRYRVEQVLYPEMDFESAIYDEWLRLVGEKGVKVTPARAGQRISLGGGVTIEVLGPPDPPLTGTDSDVDNNAAVLRLNLGEVSFLLTADIMREAELELGYNRANLRSTVLKVGHHGSNTSTTAGFLALVRPELAVISVGADNEYGHPTGEVLERLRDTVGEDDIYRTDQDGTVEFITDGERLWLETER